MLSSLLLHRTVISLLLLGILSAVDMTILLGYYAGLRDSAHSREVAHAARRRWAGGADAME